MKPELCDSVNILGCLLVQAGVVSGVLVDLCVAGYDEVHFCACADDGMYGEQRTVMQVVRRSESCVADVCGTVVRTGA